MLRSREYCNQVLFCQEREPLAFIWRSANLVEFYYLPLDKEGLVARSFNSVFRLKRREKTKK